MARITVSPAATRKLLSDPRLRRRREDTPCTTVPALWYYRQSYTTLKDGTVVEHGDGFTLSFVDPTDVARQPKGVVSETIRVVDSLDVLMIGPEEMFAESFEIGRSRSKYTLDRLVTP